MDIFLRYYILNIKQGFMQSFCQGPGFCIRYDIMAKVSWSYIILEVLCTSSMTWTEKLSTAVQRTYWSVLVCGTGA